MDGAKTMCGERSGSAHRDLIASITSRKWIVKVSFGRSLKDRIFVCHLPALSGIESNFW